MGRNALCFLGVCLKILEEGDDLLWKGIRGGKYGTKRNTAQKMMGSKNGGTYFWI